MFRLEDKDNQQNNATPKVFFALCTDSGHVTHPVCMQKVFTSSIRASSTVSKDLV